jgi:DNA-directed RNA polymerase alpha subunit
MDLISQVETTDDITSAIFLTDDILWINMLRRAIMSEIETYAIDIVIFSENSSARHDEIIALRLGQLVIDHTLFVPTKIQGDILMDDEPSFKTNIIATGPKVFTTNDIPELPFKYETPIMVLRENENIKCEVIVKKGQGKIHAKWKPVSVVSIMELDQGAKHKITFKSVGMMSGEEILRKGIEKMKAAAERVPTTQFTRQVVPYNL